MQVEPDSLRCPQHKDSHKCRSSLTGAICNRKLEVDVVGETSTPRFGARHGNLAY